MANAFECSDCDDCSSTIRKLKPRRSHSLARNRPTGPAPTIRTFVSVGAFIMMPSFALRQSNDELRTRHPARCTRFWFCPSPVFDPSPSTSIQRFGHFFHLGFHSDPNIRLRCLPSGQLLEDCGEFAESRTCEQTSQSLINDFDVQLPRTVTFPRPRKVAEELNPAINGCISQVQAARLAAIIKKLSALHLLAAARYTS
jgi:hypothetical protein